MHTSLFSGFTRRRVGLRSRDPLFFLVNIRLITMDDTRALRCEDTGAIGLARTAFEAVK